MVIKFNMSFGIKFMVIENIELFIIINLNLVNFIKTK